MNNTRYMLIVFVFMLTFYIFTPGILFNIPSGSSKRIVALVHTLLWTVFMTLLYACFSYSIGLFFVPLFGIVFYVFTPDVLFHLPPNGSKELVAGTHSLLFAIGAILFEKLLNRMPI